MAGAAAKLQDNPDSKEFADLLNKSLGETENFSGRVVDGTVISLDKDFVLIDVGLKSEGRVATVSYTHLTLPTKA